MTEQTNVEMTEQEMDAKVAAGTHTKVWSFYFETWFLFPVSKGAQK